MHELTSIAHSVLFPVSNSIDLPDDVLRFLDNGGKSVLFGESAEEYRTGTMSPDRIAYETQERWETAIRHTKARAGSALIALDADVRAVHRLHERTPALPTFEAAQGMSDEAFERAIHAVAIAAKSLGVNLLLSPTADVVVGHNPWMTGRTLGPDIHSVARLVRAYVKAVTAAGLGSTLKHFPGTPTLTGMPASEAAHVISDMASLRALLAPFQVGVDAGASAVMMSPAIYEATHPPMAGSISKPLIHMLKEDLHFQGLVMTCDLDHRSTMGSRTVGATAIAALAAGADLLLLSPASVPQIPLIAEIIVDAVRGGHLPHERLTAAAFKVHELADYLNQQEL